MLTDYKEKISKYTIPNAHDIKIHFHDVYNNIDLIINVYNLFHIVSQNLKSLTLTKNYS
jgi:hypothetical protein